jgi:ribokinase
VGRPSYDADSEAMTRLPSAPEVVVFGSLNMDLVVRVPRTPDAGETLQAHGFTTNPGGKGANQAVACARQGARVCMVGRVGSDDFGAALRAMLAADGIDVCHIGTAGEVSGIAVIMVDDAAQDRIAVIPGANALLGPHDADAVLELTTARLLLLQCEVPMAAIMRAAAIVHESGGKVVLNPAPVCPLPDALWPLVDVLVVNEIEAATLASMTVNDVGSAHEAALALRMRGPAIAIVTLGSDGVIVADQQGCRHFAALRVQAIDTTAAGDTFIGALCAAYVAGESIDPAVARGIQAAALCVTRPGAQISIPKREELAELPQVGAPTLL